MLYSEHLWDRLDTVIEHWERERDVTTDIIDLYLRIRKLSLTFAEGIEKQLSKMTSAKLEIDPDSPIAALREYANVIARVQRGFADTLLNEIATPLQATVTIQAVAMRDVIMLGKKQSKKLQTHRKKQKKAEKRVTSLSASELNVPNLRRQGTERDVLERQKTYNETVDTMNKFLDDNADDMKQVMDTLQKCEVDRLKSVQKTLLAFAELSQTYGHNLVETGQTLLKVTFTQTVSGFDIEACLHKFVLRHLKEVDSPRRGKTVVMAGQSLEMSGTDYNVICDIMEKCWGGNEMTDLDRRDAKESLHELRGRTACLNWLNQHRANGAYEFRGLDATGDVLNILLDEAYQSWDIINACLCIVLSQTFFDSSHNFLQSKIAKHMIWQDFSFWDSAFAHKVQNDMDQFSQYCLLNADMEAERQEKLRSVLFAHFTTFMTIMSSFEIDSDTIMEFVDRQSKKYAMSSFEKTIVMSAFSTAEEP